MSGDPREAFGRALGQTRTEVAAAASGDLSVPTPCGDFDVRALLGHLVAVLRKLASAGRGDDASAVQDPALDPDDGAWAAVFDRCADELLGVWSDDALLDRDCVLPWGTMPGREVVVAYTHELTAHSWDLAATTGRVDRLDPTLAAPALEWFAREVPADDREEGGRFGPEVAAAEGADDYGRLAAFLGRPPWPPSA